MSHVGTERHFAAAQRFGRFRVRADMRTVDRSNQSDVNDPERTHGSRRDTAGSQPLTPASCRQSSAIGVPYSSSLIRAKSYRGYTSLARLKKNSANARAARGLNGSRNQNRGP